jgi:hypothetical protein
VKAFLTCHWVVGCHLSVLDAEGEEGLMPKGALKLLAPVLGDIGAQAKVFLSIPDIKAVQHVSAVT